MLMEADAMDKEANFNRESDDVRTSDHTDDDHRPHTGDGASPGKIFIGGLARETTSVQFVKHFGKYGEITDSVIMKDRNSGQPRGFGFVTYADPSVVDKVIEDAHIINGKQVEIKRTIPRGAIGSKDFKTKKIFVGGIPITVSDDDFKNFFSKFGEVKEHQIMRDHSSGRSRGFGFITFDTEQAVDGLLTNGNRMEFAGVQVEMKKAEPKKSNPPPPPSKRHSSSKATFGGGSGDGYGGYGRGAFNAESYRSSAAYGGRASAYGGYGGSEFGGYGGYGGSSFGGYRGEPSLDYSGRYGGGFGRGYDLGGGYNGLGEGYGGYGGGAGGYSGGGGAGGYGSDAGGYGGGAGAGAGGYGGGAGGSYDSGLGSGYGGGSGSSVYGNRGGYGGAGSGRYHPYGR